MIVGSNVSLEMIKVLNKGMVIDKSTYTLKVISYDSQEEKFLLEMDEVQLTKLSLDAKYRCTIFLESKVLLCEGIIIERYQCEEGNRILFLAEHGFYEKNME